MLVGLPLTGATMKFSRKPSLRLVSFATALFSASGAATSAQSEQSVWSAVSEINGNGAEVSEKAPAIYALFEKAILPRLGSLKSKDDEAVHELFRSLQTAYFYARAGDYAHRETYKEAMGGTLAELHRRGIQDADEVDSYYDGLFAAREFDAARQLKAEYAGLSFRDYARFDTRQDIDSSKPAGFAPIDDGRLSLSNIDLPSDGGYVVVVIGCHIARDAAQAIAANKGLADAMAADRVLWLLTDLELSQQSLNDWKQEFPEFKAMISYNNEKWTDVDFSASPAFHFFRDGKLVEIQVGWDGPSSESSLIRSLKAIGLLTLNE
jgi:hypothetical protein